MYLGKMGSYFQLNSSDRRLFPNQQISVILAVSKWRTDLMLLSLQVNLE